MQVVPLRPGTPIKPSSQVAFHYMYYKGKMRKTEMTEGFTCPFCLCDVAVGLCTLESS